MNDMYVCVGVQQFSFDLTNVIGIYIYSNYMYSNALNWLYPMFKGGYINEFVFYFNCSMKLRMHKHAPRYQFNDSGTEMIFLLFFFFGFCYRQMHKQPPQWMPCDYNWITYACEICKRNREREREWIKKSQPIN